MKKTKIFFINGALLTFTSLIMKSIGMIFNIYISNKIGSEAIGTFSLVMSVYMYFVILATSGLSLACTCIVSEQFAEGNFFSGIKAVKNCFLFALFLGVGSSIIILTFANTISQNWLKSVISSIPLYIISISLPFISISSVINGYFTAVRKAYKSAISQVFELVIKIIATIILLKFNIHNEIEYICICLILANVLSEILSCLLSILLYKKDIVKYNKKIKRITCINSFKKKILEITFPICITSYIRSSLSTLKQFIIPNRLMLCGITYNMALSEYGKINGMTLSILMFPTVFIMSFSNLLIPEFTSLAAKKYNKRILDVCTKAFWVTSLFSICLFLFFFFFANNISLIIFKNLECAKYIKLLSPIIFFIYSDNILDNMLKGLNKQFNVMVCNILDLILTIGFLYFLLPVLGLTGYLLAIIISEIFNFCISYFQLYKTTGFKIKLPIIFCYFLFAILSFYNIIKDFIIC